MISRIFLEILNFINDHRFIKNHTGILILFADYHSLEIEDAPSEKTKIGWSCNFRWDSASFRSLTPPRTPSPTFQSQGKLVIKSKIVKKFVKMLEMIFTPSPTFQSQGYFFHNVYLFAFLT